mgnify:CR=1 FL=1
MNRAWKEKMEQELLLFDGAMGTMIQASGCRVPRVPEDLNLENSELIGSIHRQFIDAGADFITTNTFGTNRMKAKDSAYGLQAIIEAASKIARQAAEQAEKQVYVAYDIGPIGAMMKPIGDLDFDQAYEIFKEQVIGLNPDLIDLVLIETMTDIAEMRAAILAVKEHSDFPVIATMSFTEDERSLTGTDPETMVRIIEGLGVDALGVNCSLGPIEMEGIVKRILAESQTPVIVQANAGLPVFVEGETKFSLDAATYAKAVESYLHEGLAIVGGCCGTTPEYIRQLNQQRDRFSPREQVTKTGNYVCSSTKSVNLDKNFVLIGERINPSGNKRLKEAFLQGDFNFATKVAFEQIHHGADVLDVNTSLPQIDEEEVMIELVDTFSGLLDTPLQFDSVKASVLETALRRYAGIAIVNSVNGKQSSMDELFPILKKYGAYAICLCLDENGIPHTAKERIAIAEKLIENAKKHGIEEEKLIIDTLVLTASAQQQEVMETLEAIRVLKEKTRVKTTLGVSNVSYGLPYRPLINRVFFTLALGAGLDTAIINPGAEGIQDTLQAFRVLNNDDPGAVNYIQYNEKKNSQGSKAQEVKQTSSEADLTTLLLEGESAGVQAKVEKALASKDPLQVVDTELIPALDAIGLMYEKQTIFLPQLIRAAETVKGAFELVKKKLDDGQGIMEPKGSVLLATVKGDIHDIGKNLVKIMLESYGYHVLDLGKDVGKEKILASIESEGIQLVGLSALMTTTVSNMEEIIESIQKTYPQVKVMVGGAVLTEQYAEQIGADFYCQDARAAVLVANQIF